MLGDDCNLQCKYCLQHNIKNDVTPNKINPKLINWFEKLYKENDGKKICVEKATGNLYHVHRLNNNSIITFVIDSPVYDENGNIKNANK